MASEGGNEGSSGNVHSHAFYKPCEVELSDDGSSVMSESEHDHLTAHGRRSSATIKFRKGSSNASQLSPSFGVGIQHSPGSPLASYPVSIRQQLAIFKMMEQNATELNAGAGHSVYGSSSPHSLNLTPRSRRVPKIHKKNDHGETPLHVSARKGESRQCKRLLQEGAVINAVDYAGWTPLHEACAHARFKVAKILISNGADVNAVANNGDTPLHDAVARGCEKLVWLLLNSGADREKTNHAGKKPIDICPPQCPSVKALLLSSTVPEKCPSGGDNLCEASPTDNHVEIRHPLTIAIGSPTIGIVKQPSPSPALTDVTIHSETCMQVEGSVYHYRGSEIHFQEEKEQHDNVDSDLDHTLSNEKEKSTESAEVVGSEVEPFKSSTQIHSVECTPLQRRHLWGHEGSASKNDGTLEAEVEDLDQDNSTMQEDGSSEAEPRRWVRTRGAPRKLAVYMGKPPPFSDKRKQRGRRRGRIASQVSRSLGYSQVSPISLDVYEFRCSPELDTNDTSPAEVTEDQGVSPEAKRQRLESSYRHTQGPGPSVKQEVEHQFEFSESNDANVSMSEGVDDAGGSRKVPPLRILIPRTPSEDSAVVNLEEGASVASGTRNGSKRSIRLGKNQIKKELTPDDAATPPPADSGMHRMTRSRVRQAGRVISEETTTIGYLENSVKRKCQANIRRTGVSSIPSASSMLAGAINDKEENVDGVVGTELFNGGGSSTDEGSCFAAEDGFSALAMALMRKNTYEGFRGLRAKIEESWMDALSQPPGNSFQTPANFENYMIVKREFTLRDNFNQESLTNRMEACLSLPRELQDLRKLQEEKRLRMETKHKVEKERLQMLAEREVLRMLNRKANRERDCVSAIRVLRETDVYNTWYLKEKAFEHPVVDYEQVKQNFAGQVHLMESRQKMESDALFAEQVYTWNSALRNSGNSDVLSFKDQVPRVPITHLELRL